MVLVGDEAQVQASFGPFRDSANLDVDRCMVCAKHTIGLETFLDAPDGTRRRLGSSGSSFSVRLEIVLIMTQDRCMILRRTYHRLRNYFGRSLWYS